MSRGMRHTFRYGVQWTPEEFLEKAKETQHPLDPQVALEDSVKKAVIDNLLKSPVELAKMRMRAVIMIDSMRKELEEKERLMKESLDPEIARVVQPKNLLLWEALLRASDYPDMQVVDLMKQGVSLSGEHSFPQNFPKDWRPATISREDLLESAKWRRIALKSETLEIEQTKDEDLEQATMEEVKLGFLQGPFSEDQVSKIFEGDEWLMNKRFLLYQGTPEEPKSRVIDDCKRSGLNCSYTTNFKLQLMDMDTLACVLGLIAKSLANGNADATLSVGEAIGGKVPREVLKDTWQGRTLDLSKAYKQVPLAVPSRRLCVIGHQIRGEWKFFTTKVLPFGAVASVYAFNRISKSIHHILTNYFSAVCTVFYDDFPTLSTTKGAPLLSKSLTHVLNNLGWNHAQLGSKALDFAAEFNALGVRISLEKLPLGLFTLANKQGRINKVVEMLEKIISDAKISRKAASEIQGLINFASGFYLSKALRFLLGAFERMADRTGAQTAKSLRILCRTAIALLKNLPAREFDARKLDHTHLLFTDGSWEDGRACAGAVFVNGQNGKGWVAEVEIPDALIQSWIKEVGSQIICQIEYYAFLVLRFCVAKEILNQQAVAWIDNEAARSAATKGSADSASLRSMARVSQHLELECPTILWMERVASFSNPAPEIE